MLRAGRDWAAGFTLVLVGSLLLAERRVPALVPVIPLLAGAALLLAFVVRRRLGPLVLGCVLMGAGVGVLVEGTAKGTDLAGSSFLACLAAGFLAAWLAAMVLRVPGRRAWLLVAGLLVGGLAAAVALSGRGEELRRLTVGWWPVAVIGLGLLLLAAARAGRRGHGPDDETREMPVVAAPPERDW